MRSLLAAILNLFLPARGAHRAVAPPLTSVPASPPAPAFRPAPPFLGDVIRVDGLPLVRPYVVVWECERDELDRRRLQRARRRAAVLAGAGAGPRPVGGRRMSPSRLRSLGVDPASGKEALADTCPGGLLEALADVHALNRRGAGDGRGCRPGHGEGVGRRARGLRTGVVRGA